MDIWKDEIKLKNGLVAKIYQNENGMYSAEIKYPDGEVSATTKSTIADIHKWVDEHEKQTESLKEGRLLHMAEFMSQVRKLPFVKEILKASYLGDGSAFLFAAADGNAYEIIMRPAKYAQFKDLWGKLIKKENKEMAKVDELKEKVSKLKILEGTSKDDVGAALDKYQSLSFIQKDKKAEHFFKSRFGRDPKYDPSYFEEWKKRLELPVDNFVKVADSSSQLALVVTMNSKS